MIHWLSVCSLDNFMTTQARGFDVAGFKKRWGKAASEVRAGDTLFYYITGHKGIAAEVSVTGESYYDETKIWDCTNPAEYYPHRFPIRLTHTRQLDDLLPVADFIDNYQYARKWPPGRWTLAFQGNVHRIDDEDYRLIHDLLVK